MIDRSKRSRTEYSARSDRFWTTHRCPRTFSQDCTVSKFLFIPSPKSKLFNRFNKKLSIWKSSKSETYMYSTLIENWRYFNKKSIFLLMTTLSKSRAFTKKRSLKIITRYLHFATNKGASHRHMEPRAEPTVQASQSRQGSPADIDIGPMFACNWESSKLIFKSSDFHKERHCSKPARHRAQKCKALINQVEQNVRRNKRERYRSSSAMTDNTWDVRTGLPSTQERKVKLLYKKIKKLFVRIIVTFEQERIWKQHSPHMNELIPAVFCLSQEGSDVTISEFWWRIWSNEGGIDKED